ncbi:MAG TPA: ROK family transcriptional regulator [Mycobacteriales bacterium]|nr:ROK family transcriptional regulator [Mycobacteriales bacterium]
MAGNDAGTRTLPQSVLRAATDRAVFDEILARGRATRAELAAATGISKPTISEAVRRLVDGGLLDATGPQETGRRGRIGTFYEPGRSAGWVLAIEVDQSGVQARSAGFAGQALHQHERPPGAAGDTGAVIEALRSTVREAVKAVPKRHGPLRAVAVSIANPVDPTTHEVIGLPGSPFPEGLLGPAEVLADLVRAPVLVDNDVNLAALAEHRSGGAAGAASFAYVYVGAGLGLGLYLGDQLIRGAHGLAGEIGYLPGAGPETLAAELAISLGKADGQGKSGAPANDVSAALALLDRSGDRTDKAGRQALATLCGAIVRAISSVNAIVDPELVLLGGPVGTHPALLPAVRGRLTGSPTRLAYGTLGRHAPLHGALQLALEHARSAALG